MCFWPRFLFSRNGFRIHRYTKHEGVECTGTCSEKGRSHKTQNNALDRLIPKTMEEVKRTFPHMLPLDLFARDRLRDFVGIYLSAPALFCVSLEDAVEWLLRRGRARKERVCISLCVHTCCKSHFVALYTFSRSQP